MVDRKAVETFLRKNPSSSYSNFQTSKEAVPISDCLYYTIRRKMTGINRKKITGINRKKIPCEEKSKMTGRGMRRRSNTYTRLFLTEAGEVNSEAKNLLQKFLEAMNTIYQTKMEIIEFGNPAQLEIRELTISSRLRAI
jgi:hypothetical protein